MKTQEVLPVILSILVIVLVAILEKQSKLVAALAARAGLKLVPILLTGYGVWALGAAILYLLRSTLGIK